MRRAMTAYEQALRACVTLGAQHTDENPVNELQVILLQSTVSIAHLRAAGLSARPELEGPDQAFVFVERAHDAFATAQRHDVRKTVEICEGLLARYWQ